jgi:hypothetical protein
MAVMYVRGTLDHILRYTNSHVIIVHDFDVLSRQLPPRVSH